MQQEALNRLHEMQRRSRSAVGNAAATSAAPAQSPRRGEPERPKADSKPVQSNPIQDILGQLLGDGAGLDSDRIIILLLLFVLYKNHADIKLLLALGYLLL